MICPECEREVNVGSDGLIEYHDINSMQRMLCYGSKLNPNWQKNATDGHIRWFGVDWRAPITETTEHVLTPVGTLCSDCNEAIERGDQGIFMMHVTLGEDGQPAGEFKPQHRECHLRHVIGGLNHQKGTCSCQGGPDDPDPPEMTRREAAKAAVAHFENNQEVST